MCPITSFGFSRVGCSTWRRLNASSCCVIAAACSAARLISSASRASELAGSSSETISSL